MITAPPRAFLTQHHALIAHVGLVIALGCGVIADSIYRIADVPNPINWILLGALAIIAATFALKVPGVPAYLSSISDTLFITSALVFGPAPATLTIAVDSLIVSLRRRNNLRQTAFNSTCCALALWCGVQVYYMLSVHGPLAGTGQTPDGRTLLPLACLAAVYFLLNSSLTAVAVALSKGGSPLRLWRQHFAMMSLNYFASASASFFLIVLVEKVGLTAVAAIMPVVLVCYVAMRSRLGRVEDAQRHVDKVNQLYLSTVSALSTAIEAKDGVTSEHIHRVQSYALGLARALGITDQDTVRAIEAAALLHDTGKLAIPEHILNKPGKLTPTEFETMKSHVDVGADILSSIEFPYPVVPIVRAHHENWNGSGYPNGLKGEEIPVGARILSVVDCFDALVSDRPYRPAMSEVEALQIIVERRGTMYDPDVVDMFLQVYRDIAPSMAPTPQLQQALGRIRVAHARVVAPAERTFAAPPAGSESEELLAFVSLARLASRTPTIGDIGALAWGHIRHLAPRASLALFTVDAGRNALVAQYVAGSAASRLSGMVMGVGQRLSGWAAANSRAVVNSDARLDLVDDPTEELRYAVAMPLIADGTVVGVMTLYAVEPFIEDRSRMLEMIAPHLAASVASASGASASAPGSPAETEAARGKRPGLRVVSSR